MSKIFYSDIRAGRVVSYSQLVEDIQKYASYSPYCKSGDYYEVFLKIVTSLILGREVILLDADFSDAEVEKLVGNVDIYATESVTPVSILTEENFLELLTAKTETWKITLFTSGTTGLPKKVSHSFNSIARQAKRSERHANDVWGFAYNPTHMAGLQVFFQALLNQNTIVRLFGLDSKEIISEINKNQITHISATPTFYRLLLPPTGVCSSVKRLTSGGEKFDEHTLGLLSSLFPNAKLTNVYASTEAGTLFASKGNEFCIKEDMKDKVCIREGELLIHKSLLAESASIQFDGDWYHTGDLIEVSCQEPLTFHFISRKTEMINVGGYKVNPTEVEECIRECKGVQDAFVYGKANRIMGNIIMGEVVREDESVTEKSIREELQQKLQEFKIPRIIKFVEHLNVTRTGKISRK